MLFRSRKFGLILTLLMIAAFSLSACKPATPAPTAEPTEAQPTVQATAGPTVAPTEAPVVLDGAVTTDSGLQYLVETSGSGALPKEGELVTMNFIASLADGTELQNTYTQGRTVTTIFGVGRLLPGWEEGVGLMKVGTKAKMVLPAKLAFGEAGNGSIPPNTQLILEVELMKSEPARVPADVAADKLTTTTSGLQYYDIVVGDGKEAAKNSTVSNGYTMWFKTGSEFSYVDSSKYSSTIDFVVGHLDTVFPGWDEGVTGMKVGGKRLLVIPPDLGLGSQANGVIPANSILVMEVELLNVTDPRTATKVDEKDYTTTASGLKYYDLVPGTGASPTSGQTVTVHYTGWLEDGTQFDSSVDRGQPFSFVLGTGGVIAGWDEGVATMKVGGKRQLVVPAALGYGESGSGGVIPPNATLIFEVELLEIK